MPEADHGHLVICAAARDCGEALPSVLAFFENLAAALQQPRFVFVENDSVDQTRTRLDAWQAARSDCTILSPAYPIAHLKRTERLSYCRNMLLDHIRQNCAHFDYVLMIDVDEPLVTLDVASILSGLVCLKQRPEAIAVFANSLPVYYDVWALRHPIWCPRDCWDEIRRCGEPAERAVAAFVHGRQLPIDPQAPPIRVKSAFNGLGIYRLPAILSGRYCGVDLAGRETCEHVAFHMSIASGDGRFYILPSILVGAPCEHLAPAFRPPAEIAEEPTTLRKDLMKRLFGFGKREPAVGGGLGGAGKAEEKPGPTVIHNVGSHIIELPHNHKLPVYQRLHRLYDRFLPVLAASLPRSVNHAIVDVGANVGDTAAAMFDACAHAFVCIEGHAPYFDLLTTNVRKHLSKPERFTLIRSIVGTGTFQGVLNADGSTSSLVFGSSEAEVQSLDKILDELGVLDRVAMLKIDTDGFDGDVILSASDTLARSQPLLFWENQFADGPQRHALERAYDSLIEHGYDSLWVFDNFGNLLLENASFEAVNSFNDYVAAQDKRGCTRTIFYTDILAARSRDRSIAVEAVSRYKRDVINA